MAATSAAAELLPIPILAEQHRLALNLLRQRAPRRERAGALGRGHRGLRRQVARARAIRSASASIRPREPGGLVLASSARVIAASRSCASVTADAGLTYSMTLSRLSTDTVANAVKLSATA